MKKALSLGTAFAMALGFTGCVEEGYLSFVQKAATVSSLSLSFGPVEGGQTITLTGTEFTEKVSITLNDKPCTQFTFISKSSVTCVVPANPAGSYPVVTKTSSGGQNKGPSYTYQGAPTVSAITPNATTLGGGKEIKITGERFMDGAVITFNGTECGSVKVDPSHTSLTCLNPAGTAGFATVVVKNLDKQASNPRNDLFYYNGPPQITGVSPASGPAPTPQTVTITGKNFRPSMEVKVGGSECTGIANIVTTGATHSLTCTRAAGAPGKKAVWIRTNPDSQEFTQADAYEYVAAPGITKVTPATGPVSGTQAVTITGDKFQSVKSVTIGGATCASPVTVNATTINCTRPAGSAGAKEVRVVNFDNQLSVLEGGYVYQAGPAITSITPARGPQSGGTEFVITGSNFRTGVAVSVGGTACATVTFVSDTSVKCKTAAFSAAGLKAVVATDEHGQTASFSGFTADPPPTLGGISPNSGPTVGTQSVAIAGTNFVAGAKVSIGGTDCPVTGTITATAITCTRQPGSAGAKDVKVVNPDGQSITGGVYTFVPPPTLSSITPNQGSVTGGQVVTITGTDLHASATAKIGGKTCDRKVAVSGANTFRCETPTGTKGAQQVVVTNPDGQTSAAQTYTYVDDVDGCVPASEYDAALAANNGTAYELKKGGSAATSSISVNWAVFSADGFKNIPLDVGFLVDITGTMSASIANLRVNLPKIVDEIDKGVAGDARYGLATFTDHFVQTDIPYARVVHLNYDKDNGLARGTRTKEQLGNLQLGYGGDAPEADYTGLYQIATGSGMGAGELINGAYGVSAQPMGWNTAAKKVVILATDDVIKDPTAYSNFLTKDRATSAIKNNGIKVVALSLGDNPLAELTKIATDTGSLRADGSTLVFRMNRDGTSLPGSSFSDIAASIVEGIRQAIVYDVGVKKEGTVASDITIGGLSTVLPLRKDQAGTFNVSFLNATPATNPNRCIYRKVTVAASSTETGVLSRSSVYLRLENN